MIARRMNADRFFIIAILVLITTAVFLLVANRDQASWENGRPSAAGKFRPYAVTGGDVATKSRAYATTTGAKDASKAAAATAPADAQTLSPFLSPLALDDRVPPAAADNRNLPPSTQPPSQAPLLSPHRDPLCDGFPDTSSILLIMKTGATEAFDKLPVQIMTVLKCLPDFLLFSDLEQHIAGQRVRDSLATVLAEAQDANPDFDLYRAQQACPVDQEECIKNLEGAGAAGWKLDKYKNIHMAEKAYRLRPDYDWYVFVDADTYVSWPNMVYALRKMDPAQQRYLGVPTVIGDKLFAHGGSGYIVSRGAMKEFAGKHPGIANQWDAEIRNHCCGDFVFAQAVKDTLSIEVEDFWPLSNGEKPFTTGFGPGTWCHAVGMMHHMNSEEISSFWEFERQRYRTSQTPLVFSEVYRAFFGAKLQRVREDWDNAADHWFYLDFNRTDPAWDEGRLAGAVPEADKTEAQKAAHESWERCQAACLAHDDCFQFSWHDERCAMHRSFRLGRPAKKETEERLRTVSGWDVDKIEAWIQKEGQCGDRVEWPYPVRLAMSPEVSSG